MIKAIVQSIAIILLPPPVINESRSQLLLLRSGSADKVLWSHLEIVTRPLKSSR